MKQVEEQRITIQDREQPFSFKCHPGVSCYLHCCHKVTLYLFPYDIVRLKNGLGIHSAEFLQKYVRVVEGSHPYFPGLILNLLQEENYPCPFLTKTGCSVYRDRPSACRTYPLERGVESPGVGQALISSYSLVKHPYCKGHFEDNQYTISQWERDQQLYEYNLMNDLWAETDAFFASNPWQGEGKAGPRQQLAFMVCYNIDGFREYAQQHNLFKQFRVGKEKRRRMNKDDGQLLQFGFRWIQHVLGGKQIF